MNWMIRFLRLFFTRTPEFSFFGFLLIVLTALATIPARAELASQSDMEQVCRNWLHLVVSETGSWAGDPRPEIIRAEDIVVGNIVIGRYFAISPDGYIVVPILRELVPVKAYSETGTLDINDNGGMMQLIKDEVKSRLDVFISAYGNLAAQEPPTSQLFDPQNRQNWEIFSSSDKTFNEFLSGKSLAPMSSAGPLLTTAWHQDYPYNMLCPTGDGGRCVVGCVATAAAQIIYYHQWPPAGEGEHSYYWDGDESCEDGTPTPGGTLSADFSDPYTYDNSDASVAEISYEMGVAFDMDYGACGSGAYTLEGAQIFPAYFRYDQSAQAIYRSSYSPESWFDLIVSDINKGRPILYRINLHAIVCDGWRILGGNNQYHFNYGWGGSQNAWYTVDNLYCPWEGCDPMVEGMVINLIPLNASPWLSNAELSDATYGDGDGVAEKGETIEMLVTFANYGGADITDLSAVLAVDDASLSLIDATTYIPSIPALDSVKNTADPFIIAIPADYVSRVDSFLIEVTYNGGQGVDTLVVQVPIGRTNILLVDDDNYDYLETYYTQGLDNFLAPYDIYSLYNAPDSAFLSNYEMVIWFTGDFRTGLLSSSEINGLKGYLNGGGRLFLTGQGIASQLNMQDPGFLNNYLKSAYHETAAGSIVIDVSDGDLFDSGDTLVIFGASAANNQTNADRISAVNDGILEGQYLGSSYHASVSYSGSDYRMVFFGFGFEAIKLGDRRFVDQDSTLAKVFRFLDQSRPSAAPFISDIDLAGPDSLHILDHTPDINWEYFDEDGSPQAGYQIQVGLDTIWAVDNLWDYGPIFASDGAVEYAGNTLGDGGRYYLRIRVFDGRFWSGWKQSMFIMNSLPQMVADLAPNNMSAANSATPVLSHRSSSGVDGPNVTYSYELYDDPELINIIASAQGQPQRPTPVTWQVPVTLNENEDYYWRARADDQYEQGQWSEPASFWVNAINNPPTPFALVVPANEAVAERTPVFTWQSSSDSDPYDHITYKLVYSTSPSFTGSTKVSGLTDTGYALQNPLPCGVTYYWKIEAADMLGSTTIGGPSSMLVMIAGDANGDRSTDVGDAVYLINFAFKSGPSPLPYMAGDANSDGTVNVGDAVFIINYTFKGGPAPSCQ